MQLVRNAIAHGIEPPFERTRAGKQTLGTISLHAERLGDWLRLVVEDDGRGVDIARVREAAVASGTMTARPRPWSTTTSCWRCCSRPD